MVAILSGTGLRLMPTSAYRARKLLKSGRARIHAYDPFTIQLLTRETGETQPVEYKSDTGYLHVGISVCSEKHEYVSEERTLIADETEKHNNRRKYRRERRNRKRYRKARFNNRTHNRKEEWFAPSVRHRMERQIDLFEKYNAVMPITSATLEMGKIDIQALAAEDAGQEKPEGKDYQQGARYLSKNLRTAVFTRDGYKCRICGRGAFDSSDPAKLHEHHIGFWKGDRTDRLGNLLTVCEKCHTGANHAKGGALWGLKPESDNYADATYMNIIRFAMLAELKGRHPEVTFHIQYGAKTACYRASRNIRKTHADDAYCIGSFHPKHRAHTAYWQKVRRNDRVLQDFYDAQYADLRTGKAVKAKELGCGRTKRNTHLAYENLRRFRGKKQKKGYISVRRRKPDLIPGAVVHVYKTRTIKGRKGMPDRTEIVVDETAAVFGTHARYRKDKLTGEELLAGINVQFVKPLSNGDKSADMKWVTPYRPEYKRAWCRQKPKKTKISA